MRVVVICNRQTAQLTSCSMHQSELSFDLLRLPIQHMRTSMHVHQTDSVIMLYFSLNIFFLRKCNSLSALHSLKIAFKSISISLRGKFYFPWHIYRTEGVISFETVAGELELRCSRLKVQRSNRRAIASLKWGSFINSVGHRPSYRRNNNIT